MSQHQAARARTSEAPRQSMIAPRSPGRTGAEAADQLSRSLALRAAATAIASRTFLTDDPLPRIRALDGATLGHSVLFDYALYAKTVWLTALDLRDVAIERARRSRLVVIVTLAVDAGLAGVSFAFRTPLPIAIALLAAATLLDLAMLRRLMGLAALREKGAARRAQAVDLLATGSDPYVTTRLPSPPAFQPVAWGNGRFDRSNFAPVLFATDKRAFPGFGDEALRHVFVHVPSPVRGTGADPVELEQGVRARIGAALTWSPRWHLLSGDVVIVDARAVTDTSAWVDGDKRPILWFPLDHLPGVDGVDRSAAARRYFAVQILFPEHGTSAAFFVRTFAAGGAAAVELALTSLGPIPPSGGAPSESGWFASAEGRLRHLTIDDDDGPAAGETTSRERHSRAMTENLFARTEIRATLRALHETLVNAIQDELAEQGFAGTGPREREEWLRGHGAVIDRIGEDKKP
jgi:hypothetical protein